MPVPSTEEAARVDPCAHAYVRGAGFLRFEEHEVLPHGPVLGELRPPVGTVDGSVHLLVPPYGALPMGFTWLASQQAWLRRGGHRLAFAARYLASHGWRYGRPA